MEFGKKVRVGNFYMLKYSKSLSKKELSALRKLKDIPTGAREMLSRGSLPYIKVSTVTDSWSVEFVVGMGMFNALDELEVVHDGDGVYQLYGTAEKNAHAMFVAMLADTTTIGDTEYNIAKQKLLSEYVERASAARVASDSAGKSDDELRAESDVAIEEVATLDEHGSNLLDMCADVSATEGGAL